MPNFFVDVLQDFFYASSWPSRQVRPILKVKRAPKRAYHSFRQFSCAIANHFLGYPNSYIKNAKLFVDVRQVLVYAANWPSRPVLPILKILTSKMPNFFVDILEDLVYASSLPSQLVRPILKIPTSKMPIIFVDVHQDLVYAAGCPSQHVRPILKVKRAPKRAYPSFRRFSCAIANHFLGYQDFDVKNAKFFCGYPSRPCLCSRLALTASTTNFEGQTFPEASIPLISKIFVCFNKPFFSDLDRRQKFQNILLTSVNTLDMQPVIRIPTSKMPNFFVDVRQVLGYASSCPSPNQFLGYPDSDVNNAKFFCGRPSRPCLCSWLSLTDNPTHFEVNHFLGDPDSDVKNAKFICGRPSRPCLCIQVAITSNPTHFHGQTISEESIPKFRRFSQFAITANPTHFQGQTSPEASIPQFRRLF
uniref:Uncharacterized protein n=1 Tax=Solanum lycopersicum TaxID=4081 RepID=A0A3Q7FQ70_SOLLC